MAGATISACREIRYVIEENLTCEKRHSQNPCFFERWQISNWTGRHFTDISHTEKWKETGSDMKSPNSKFLVLLSLAFVRLNFVGRFKLNLIISLHKGCPSHFTIV